MIYLLVGLFGWAHAQDVPAWADGPPVAPAASHSPTGPNPRNEASAESENEVEPVDLAMQAQLEVALRSEAAEEWSAAIMGYRAVLRNWPKHPPAVMGLGRSLQGEGSVDRALSVFEEIPDHPEAVDSRAFLLRRKHPLQAAALYRRLQEMRPGDPWPHLGEARAMLGIDPVVAADAIDGYLSRLDAPPKEDAILDVVGALRGADQDVRAEALMVHCLSRWPDSVWSAELRARLDRMRVERKASELGIGGAQPLSPDLKFQVEEARRRAADGDLERALDALREVVRAAPRSAEAWAAVGDLHAMMGTVSEAERAFGWAVALEPDEATWHVRLGMLLTRRYGGKRDREARDELRTALSLRPSWPELHFYLAGIHQRLRDFDAALSNYQGYLSAQPSGSLAVKARAAVADLSRRAPEPMVKEPSASTPADVPASALTHYRVARVYRDQNQLERAKEELAQALSLAPDWTAAINLRAALALSDGDEDGAVVAWERSLEVDPKQGRVRMAMGTLYRERGALGLAEKALIQAARDGAVDAHYVLADMAFERGEYTLAEKHLTAFLANSTGGLSGEPALALRQQVARRLSQLRMLKAGAALVLVVFLVGFVLRRRSAQPLSVLITKAPESAHDIARLISAIRHELLKHNTSLLGEMAVALEHGDTHAVAWGAERLFGGPDRPGVVDRFHSYCAVLTRLGRPHGVRLDLRRADPVFAPIFRALRVLKGLERELRRVPRKPSARANLARELEDISDALNVTAYEALGLILQRLGTLRLDGAIVTDVDARIRLEPELAGKRLPALALESLPVPVPVRMYPGDLADVIANLLRNAYQAVSVLDEDEARIGVGMRVVVDSITGIETVQLRFRDTAPGGLTSAMLHGRGIGRGLGLTVDLVARHDGTIHVEPEYGWAKAVVVSLRRVEQAGMSQVEVEE